LKKLGYKKVFISAFDNNCMMNIILIILIVCFILLLWVKLEHNKRMARYLVTLIIILVILFFVFVGFSSNAIDLSDGEGILNALSLYTSWLFSIMGTIFDFTTKATGKVIEAISGGR
jgi:uncharacterized membrane protein